tara:strand:+ start:1581 stop:3953 length:2373 start_codon:yes stop_codon:yes gene_type:complete
MKYYGKKVERHDTVITGSTLTVDLGANSGSTAITTNNITVGYPTANRWGDNLVGSYLNLYDHNTNVSEMLRFMAGVLSHSLDTAAPTPNTKIWNSVSTNYSGQSTTSKSSLFHGTLGNSSYRLSQHWTSSAYIQMNETQSFIEAEDYFISKGFMNVSERGTFGNHTGVHPFNDSYCANIPNTILQSGQFGNLTFTNTSVSAGSTNVSSSVDTQLFGLGGLTNGGATSYTVRVIASQSFSDVQSDTTPDASSTFHTKSFVDYTQTSFGTTGDGLTLAKMITGQPAVIPSAFQDGKFVSIDAPQTGRKRHGGSTNNTSISSSGYYQMHDTRVGLKSGSQADFVYKNASNSNTVFYMPNTNNGSFTSQGAVSSNIISGAPTATISNATLVETGFSAASRSLSGAPYLLTTTYSYNYSAESTNHFNPVYGGATAPIQNSISTNGWNTIGNSNLGGTTSVSVTTSGVQTNSGTAGVRSADKATQRTNGTIPHITDGTFLSSSYSFSLSSNYENVGQNRTSNNSLNYSLALRTTSRNYAGTTQTSTTSTQTFYDATKFGQPSASGSMAIYSRSQGYDAGSLTGTSEAFSGEDFRIKLLDNVTAFNGTYFTTDSFQTNDEGDSVLGNLDLQVKPGYLVDPGGNYGYWFYGGFGSGTYKYYIRRFQTSGVKGSLTVGCGKSLNAWSSTSDGISLVVIFKSGTSAGSNTSIATCRLYDPTQTVSNLIESGISNDNHKNPFSSNVDLYGNTGGSSSGTNFTMPLRNADGMFLDNSDNGFYVVIRYKGDPAPVTSISTSTS